MRVNNYSVLAEQIKDRVSMRDAIALYAPNYTPRYDRIPCPIHNGQNYNLSFSDKLFHCFKCNEGGDLIHFVMHVFGLKFRDAIEKINADFRLGLPTDRRPTLREKRDAQRRQKELAQERERREQAQREYEELYNALWDAYSYLDKNRMEHAPVSPDDEWHPLFVEAVKNIDYVSYLIDAEL